MLKKTGIPECPAGCVNSLSSMYPALNIDVSGERVRLRKTSPS